MGTLFAKPFKTTICGGPTKRSFNEEMIHEMRMRDIAAGPSRITMIKRAPVEPHSPADTDPAYLCQTCGDALQTLTAHSFSASVEPSGDS